MTNHCRKVEEPDWLKILANDSLLNARDVAEIFGISSKSLWKLIHINCFPEPDIRLTPDTKHIAGNGAKSRQWKVTTVRAEILRRQQQG